MQLSPKPLSGKVAIVTGAGRGIGRIEALSLARAGAKVLVSDFGKDASGRPIAEAVVAEIRDLGTEAASCSEDLRLPAGAARVVGAAVEQLGGVDILVNNAGLRGGNPIHKLTDEQWNSVLDSHLKASFLLMRESVVHMRARGGGAIVNTGSEAGLGMPFNSAYSAAKEGLAGLTRSAARELGRFNIRCNLVRPRATAGQTGGGEWFQQKLQGEWQPLLKALGENWIGNRGHARWDRPATPDSIGAFVTWLCTPAADHVNGQDFFVGGEEIALITPPQFSAAIFREGGWTTEALGEFGGTLTHGLENVFRVDNPLKNDD